MVRRCLIVVLSCAAIGLLPAVAVACNVPVFRYALERWQVDPYELIVFHEGPLGDDNQASIDWLEEQRVGNEFFVRTVDVSGDMSARDRKDYESAAPPELPWLAALYPDHYSGDPPALSAKFDRPLVESLPHSPLRREIARKILEGESVVWLLVESGDAAQDAAAKEMLERTLSQLEDELELPDLEPEDDQYLNEESPTPLKLSFTLLTLPKSNESETILRNMMMNRFGADDAIDRTAPMAFAFFGRGRVFGPLVGEEIKPEWLAEACQYLIGACSCQIKDENPGWDILMAVDWDGVVNGYYTLAEALPRLTTAAAVVEQQAAVDAAIGDVDETSSSVPFHGAEDDHPPSASMSVALPIASAVAGCVVVVILASVGMVVMRKRSGPSA